MFKKLIFIFLLFAIHTMYSDFVYAESNEPVYTQLRVVDAGTFNEYRYRITDEFFNLRGKYEIDGKIDITSAGKILDFAKKGYNYLPDSLSNKNYYNYLKTSIERGIKYPNNSSNYTEIVGSIENFLDKTNIKSIKGKVDAFPKTGNAPLSVSLRGNVSDPTGTKIPYYNYTWWIHKDGKRKVLANGISLNYLFKEEGNFSIFLDVTSDHKNINGYTDVLPFSSRADITIKEKIASVIIKVNSTSLRNKNELKFTPDEARYGLLFDATSSTATTGSEFIKTTWEFGNGVIKEYDGNPRVERIIYAQEGEYTVTLTLQTNELKKIERKFVISVHDPIATINASKEEGYLGDKFTFSAQNTGNDTNLSYSWEIIDLNQDKVILRKSGTLFTYSFKEKGKYNVKMNVVEASGETDTDSKIIYINSRAPVSDFTHSIPLSNKPNRVFLDGTKSFDPDFSDEGKLKYSWIIDGERIELEESNSNGSNGYFTFDSIGEHSVVLEVEDPDNISSVKKGNVSINSILSVDLFAFPRVTQRNTNIRFVSTSSEAKFFEWDFGDGYTKMGKDGNIFHKFKKSGIFSVKLKVRDSNDKINTVSKNVYIGESNSPLSFLSVQDASKNDILFDESACEGKGAYIVNRVDSVLFSGKESIDITGENIGLTYSWKLGKESYKNSAEFNKRFDELGCYPIKLTVKSDKNGKTHSSTKYIKVKNLKPILSSIDLNIVNESVDPVVVNVTALGAKDRDGVIQSYLWYYYTDIDSEPQDFRATKSPSTSFVLPKITGNYYFVVVMKDSNEERVSSEEITGSKYFITLSGDNLNTPLVKLKVNDSSVAIGDETIFTASAENILGQDLSKKVSYSWDFDGDGFYDKETTSNVVIYKYISSGEKHVKVKAKYKGFSNTKSITIDVSNVITPDFGYISIGNKFIFFNKSIGISDSYEWNLGDGTIIKNKEYFTYEYKDKKASHIVNLKVSEGTKVKNIDQKITKKVKNIILARKDGLVVFSSPQINDKEQIILENLGDNAFIYLGESKPDVSNFIIDFDLEYDSDLNGGNDDDEDNKKLDSYTSGGIIKVELNKNKFQKIRIFIKNSNGELINSKDITIVKKYIEEEKLIDLNSIIFKGVSESSKFKIEKLKEYIDGLPKEYRFKGLMYVQKLQEEWGDNRGKTNVILEFEGFIYDTGVSNVDEITNLLESLLVENQEDKSEKAITFNALKNLIPLTILCDDDINEQKVVCYESMISKLEAIRDNENIDENRALGTEILKNIAVDKVMTNKEKTDFKAILKTFIYGGVSNIPKEEREEILFEESNNGGSSSDFMSLFINIIKWFFIIIGIFIFIILLYYIYYLLVNKDKNIGFQDFIIEKTSGVKQMKKEENNDDGNDILADLLEEVKEEPKKEEPKKEESKKEESKKEEIIIKKEEKNKDNYFGKGNEKNKVSEIVEVKKEEGDIPDWLKGSFSEDISESKIEQEIKKEEKPKIREEFKEENLEIKKEEKPEMKKEEVKIDILSDKKIEEITKLEEPKTKVKEDNIPDWLKGSFTEDNKEKKVVSKETTKEITKEIKKDSKVKGNIKSEDNIPDWLKGSFDEEVKKEPKKEVKKEPKKEVKKEGKKESKKEEIKEEINEVKKVVDKKEIKEVKEVNKKTEIKNKEVNKKETPKVEIKQKIQESKQNTTTRNKSFNKPKTKVTEAEKKEPIKKIKDKKSVIKKDDITKQKEKSFPELWDDGMKVPDWLKTDEEK